MEVRELQKLVSASLSVCPSVRKPLRSREQQHLHLSM